LFLKTVVQRSIHSYPISRLIFPESDLLHDLPADFDLLGFFPRRSGIKKGPRQLS
jgi:hypothetical protein